MDYKFNFITEYFYDKQMTIFEKTIQESRQTKTAFIDYLTKDINKFRYMRCGDFWYYCNFLHTSSMFINGFIKVMKPHTSDTEFGHSAIGIILCTTRDINEKKYAINLLLQFGYKPTPKDLQIAQINFYDALLPNDKERLTFIIKIFDRQDFGKIIIKFLIHDLMITYMPLLLY